LHDKGYRFCWPPRIGDLTPREKQTLLLADRTDAYLQQAQRTDSQTGDRPGHFNNVSESRKDAFQ
jgi:hypothetical protein